MASAREKNHARPKDNSFAVGQIVRTVNENQEEIFEGGSRGQSLPAGKSVCVKVNILCSRLMKAIVYISLKSDGPAKQRNRYCKGQLFL